MFTGIHINETDDNEDDEEEYEDNNENEYEDEENQNDSDNDHEDEDEEDEEEEESDVTEAAYEEGEDEEWKGIRRININEILFKGRQVANQVGKEDIEFEQKLKTRSLSAHN
jgi:hypothetical protein